MQRDLTQFIENIKNKNFDSLNERQVETSVVIPLLESLGWDTTIEDEVKVQSGIGKGKSDIELRTEGLCKVIIDAKKGKANLVNIEFERQLMSYAGGVNNGEPSDLAILTNGRNWQFYLPSIDGGYNKKRFHNIDIFGQDLSDVTYIFNELLLKNNIIDGSSLKRALSINEQRLRSEIIKHEKEIKEIREPTKIIKEYPQNFLPVDSDFTKKSIESYYFNGSIYGTDSWKGLLIGVLDNIYTSHKKDFDIILGVTGGYGRIYFSQNPKEINNPLEIKNTGIFVDTKLSANNIVRLCSDTIYEFGYSNDDLGIKISSGTIGKKESTKPSTPKTKDYLSVNDDFTGMTINSFFFDKEEYDVNSWREMLVTLIGIIHSKHKRKFDRILDIEGSQGKRYFSKRRILDDPIEIEGTGIFVEGKLGSKNIVKLCYSIINEFGYSDEDLKIDAC